jgi:hypothetical protein
MIKATVFKCKELVDAKLKKYMNLNVIKFNKPRWQDINLENRRQTFVYISGIIYNM